MVRVIDNRFELAFEFLDNLRSARKKLICRNKALKNAIKKIDQQRILRFDSYTRPINY